MQGALPQAEATEAPFERRAQAPQDFLVTKKSFTTALRTCPRKSGAGASGSRLEHWQVLLSNDQALSTVHRVLNDLARGSVPGGRLGCAGAGFLLGLLTPLAKDLDGGIRPIAVPEPLRRLLARCVTSEFKDKFSSGLGIDQCAVGLAGGAEVMHKTCTTFAATHRDYVFFKLDSRNAFNEQWRSVSVAQASEDVPELAGLWSLCYCRGNTRSRYLFRRGGETKWVFSDAGVDQGDGLAPALFSFGLKRCLVSLRQQLQSLCNEQCGGASYLLTAFLDDIVVAVPRELAGEVIPAATLALSQAGLTLQPAKSLAWSPTGERPSNLPAEVQWGENGFVVVGSALADHVNTESAFLELGLSVGAGASYDAPAEHWDQAAESCYALLEKLLDLKRRRTEIGEAQGEAVLNSNQCVLRALRLCVEPKFSTFYALPHLRWCSKPSVR